MRKTERQAIADHAPWKPPSADPQIVAAFQALQRGNATTDQQKRALEWLVKDCSQTYDLSYRPGDEGRRDTDFAEGRRFVGLQIVKLLNLKIGLLTKREGE